jgi:hypothetical protein
MESLSWGLKFHGIFRCLGRKRVKYKLIILVELVHFKGSNTLTFIFQSFHILRLYLIQTHETPLEIHFVYLGKKVCKDVLQIYVLSSVQCYLFHDFIVFCSNNHHKQGIKI